LRIMLVLLFLPAMALTQVTTANFYAIVTDSSGALIPNASVTLTHTATGTTISRETGNMGEVGFTFLIVGTYRLRIEAQGFKSTQSDGIDLVAGQQARQTFALQVGAVSETLTVEGAAPQINTMSAEQQQTFESVKVTELPLARRNLSNILAIGTGVSRSTSQHGTLRMNGLGQSGTAISLDGTEASGNPEGRSAGMFQNFNQIDLVSIDAVQEVQIIKGVTPAEYGRALGGQINVITRSGTNQFHGSLFENFQAENLNARNQNLPNKPGATFNQFGSSAGGPVRRDRIFFFGAYEGYRDATFRRVDGDVPTESMRRELIAAVPSYDLALRILPLPNTPHAANATAGYYQSAGTFRGRDNHVMGKGDLRLFGNGSLALTYARMRPSQLTPRLFPNGANDQTHSGLQERGTLNFITGGAAWASESRFGITVNDMNRIDRFFDEGRDPNRPEETAWGRRIGRIQTTLGWSTPGSEARPLTGNTWSVSQKYARFAGKHSLKFGGEFVHESGFRTNPENPVYNYANRADLLANRPSSVRPTFGSAPYAASQWTLGGFAQDDWRWSRKLVINLGVRYDYFAHMVARPTTEVDAALYNLDGLLDSSFRFGPYRDPKNPINSDGGVNLQPRIGFSLNPDGKSRTAIRGGFGVMFTPQMLGTTYVAVGAKLVPSRVTFSRQEIESHGIQWPMYNDDLRKFVERDAMSSGKINIRSVFDPNLQNPYSMNWSLGVQHSITSTVVLESSYVGNRGVKFLLHRWFNQVDRITGIRPNPNLGEGYYLDGGQNTVYNSWQNSLRKRFSHNFSGSLHYTWGKALATGGGGDTGASYQGDNAVRVQDFFNARADRGPSVGDIMHSMTGEWIYNMPSLRTLPQRWMSFVLGDWQVSGVLAAQTGDAITVTQTSPFEGSRADYIGGRATLDDYRTTLRFLNRDAFARVPLSPASGVPIRPGNAGVGLVRGPGLVNLDLGIGKDFPIQERVRLKLRADLFNGLNHTNLSGLVTEVTNSNFGMLRSTRGARIIQLNAKLTW